MVKKQELTKSFFWLFLIVFLVSGFALGSTITGNLIRPFGLGGGGGTVTSGGGSGGGVNESNESKTYTVYNIAEKCTWKSREMYLSFNNATSNEAGVVSCCHFVEYTW